MLNPAQDMSKFKEVAELRRKQFFQALSAEKIVEIKALLTPEAMIEIEAIGAVAADDGLFASGPFNDHPLLTGRYALKRNRVTSMAAAMSVCV
jgi:hypothetical protein